MTSYVFQVSRAACRIEGRSVLKLEVCCRSTWGKWTAAYKLQAFLEAAIGVDRLKTIQRDLVAFQASIA